MEWWSNGVMHLKPSTPMLQYSNTPVRLRDLLSMVGNLLYVQEPLQYVSTPHRLYRNLIDPEIRRNVRP